MDNLTAVLVLLLVALAGAIVVGNLALNQASELRDERLPGTPLFVEEVTRGYLHVRNLGSGEALVDALYVYDPTGEELIATYRYPTPIKLAPGEVKRIPIPPALFGKAPYGSPVLYKLGEGTGGIASLAGPFFPLGGVTLTLFLGAPLQNPQGLGGSAILTGVLPLPQGNLIRPHTLLLYFDEEGHYHSLALPSYDPVDPVTNNFTPENVPHSLPAAVRLPGDRVLLAVPSYAPTLYPLVMALVDPHRGTHELLALPPGLSFTLPNGGSATLAGDVPIGVSDLAYDPVTGRVYFVGYARLSTQGGGSISASVVGYLDLKTRVFKLMPLWAEGSPAAQGGTVPLFRDPLVEQLMSPRTVEIVVGRSGVAVVGPLAGDSTSREPGVVILDKELTSLRGVLVLNYTVAQPYPVFAAGAGDTLVLVGWMNQVPPITFPTITPDPTQPPLPIWVGVITLREAYYVATIDLATGRPRGAAALEYPAGCSPCIPLGAAVAGGRLYTLLVYYNSPSQAPSLQGLYIAEHGLGTGSPQALYNLTLLVNGSAVYTNPLAGPGGSILSVSSQGDYIDIAFNYIVELNANTIPTPVPLGTGLLRIHPEVLRLPPPQGAYLLRDPPTNTTVEVLVDILEPPAPNPQYTQELLTNITTQVPGSLRMAAQPAQAQAVTPGIAYTPQNVLENISLLHIVYADMEGTAPPRPQVQPLETSPIVPPPDITITVPLETITLINFTIR